MPATIWFFVRLEMSSPIDMNDAPISSRPEIAGQNRLPFRVAVDEEDADVNPGDRQHQRVQRDRAEKLAEDDLRVGERAR